MRYAVDAYLIKKTQFWRLRAIAFSERPAVFLRNYVMWYMFHCVPQRITLRVQRDYTTRIAYFF